MAGTMRPNEMNVSTTPVLSSKTLPGIDLLKSDSKKPALPRAPRIDIEPLYTTIKSSISDSEFTTYKSSLTSFLLGNLNQDELSQRLDRILSTPALEHAHNAFMMGMYANMWRDTPEPGVANWVSSNAKPSSNVTKGTGDESEKRMKHEVMQLSRRERKRLKTLHQSANAGPDAPWVASDGTGGVMQEYHEARRAKMPDSGPTSAAGGYGKTNWDLEIRKRYTSSLFIETHEFPTATTISHRLLPICYESGLANGHTADCAEYMNIATETFIKEALTNFFQLISSNGSNYIRTADFKKKIEREERRVERGELQRVAGGELPIEAEERRKRPAMCTEDLRLAILLGDGYLGQVPLISSSISNSHFLDTPGVEDIYEPFVPSKAIANGVPATNGINGAAVAGSKTNTTNQQSWTIDLGDSMVLDDDLAWQGGSVKDVEDMDIALDSVLELGTL
ncbi:unnamed protein product [Periconia digitata]|uniref:Transcriptional regulator of RNA polII, SAGA, subunit-domain-containing protein n=1 Tax=Periconia digitata TaxID=1303443 RepID=A0A9W4UGI4_9PLEO|nr:unnamed protein product [Periconia digitata]